MSSSDHVVDILLDATQVRATGTASAKCVLGDGELARIVSHLEASVRSCSRLDLPRHNVSLSSMTTNVNCVLAGHC
jgi:hypothetical protein